MSGKPRVLLVTTGGTITMTRGADGTLAPFQDARTLVSRVPELEQLAAIDLLPISNIDSSNLQPSLWPALAGAVHGRMDDYDGFVVAHGTDTMSYTAAAMTFMLHDLPKPVVLTGAQIPLDDIGTDAHCNIINAVRVAASDVAEVLVVFGTQVIRGARAKKMSVFDMQAVATVNERPLGEIGLYIKWRGDQTRRTARRALLQADLDPDVAMTSVYPGCRPEVIEHLAATHHGLVLEGYGAGNIPSEDRSLIPAIRTASANGVPVVVCTQCVFGSTAMELYHVGRSALEAGAIAGYDMTPEAALVKLMWVLGRTRDLDEVRAMMQKPVAGEIRVPG
jgi:L-asparaginase